MNENVFIVEQMVSGVYTHCYVWAAAYALATIAIVVASLIDLYYGTEAAKARGEPILSNGLRRTIRKDLAYLSFVLMALFSDMMISMFPFYSYPFLTMLFAVGCIVIEGKSVKEKLKQINNPAAAAPEEAQKLANLLLNTEFVNDIIKLSKTKNYDNNK